MLKLSENGKKVFEDAIKDLKPGFDGECLYDSHHGTYIYQYLLQDILYFCDLSEDEKNQVNQLIDTWSTDLCNFDIVISYIEDYEILISDLLPGRLYLGSTENGDYGIWLFEESDL